MPLKNKSDLRTGVVGTGIMGQNHARIYSTVSNLIGIYDLDRRTSERISNKFSVKSFENLDEFLSKVDAITIAVPTEFHYEVAKRAISQGVHILIEKPITNNVSHAQELINLASSKNIVLAVGHIERFNPIVSYIKKELVKGSFGNLISISSRRISNYPNRIRDVGVIHDLGIHDLDIASFFSNSPIERIEAIGGNFNNPKFEDNALIIASYENKINSFVEVNWLTPTKVREINLTFDEAYLHGDYIKQEIKILKGSFSSIDHANLSKMPQSVKEYSPVIEKSEPLLNEIIDFLDSIKFEREAMVTGEDGLEALVAANLALNSLRKGDIQS